MTWIVPYTCSVNTCLLCTIPSFLPRKQSRWWCCFTCYRNMKPVTRILKYSLILRMCVSYFVFSFFSFIIQDLLEFSVIFLWDNLINDADSHIILWCGTQYVLRIDLSLLLLAQRLLGLKKSVFPLTWPTPVFLWDPAILWPSRKKKKKKKTALHNYRFSHRCKKAWNIYRS